MKLYIFFILLVCTQFSYSYRHWKKYNYSSIVFSSPEECARNCRDNEQPKNCYYSFHIELYTTVGPACDVPGSNQCIQADGIEKTLIPINRQLPGPPIQICLNDRVIVDVQNAAMGLEATIHWHGIFQNGFQFYDGVPYVTQCPIASSSTFRYDFVVKNSGTHFYHSHISTHMLDGQIGSFIVKDPPSKNPHRDLYDKDEIIIFLSDWIHELSFERFPGYYRYNILGQAAENILINGLGNYTNLKTGETTNGSLEVFTVKKGERHRIRLINSFSTVCLAEFRIEKHKLIIIAQDGENVKPKPVDKIVSATGERVDFILVANQSVDSYWIQVRGLGECAATFVQQLAILKYENGPSQPSTPLLSYNDTADGVIYNGLNGTLCNTNITEPVLCINQLESLKSESDLLKVEPDERYILPFWFFNYTDTSNDKLLFNTSSYRPFFTANDRSQLLSMFNDIAYESPASNLLTQSSSYQAICKRNQLSTCTEPCTCAQIIKTKLNNVVELVMYDAIPLTDLDHPFHLHGFAFQVFSVGQFSPMRNISREDINEVIEEHTERLRRGEYKNPPGKDTAKIPMGGYVIVRFKADNPGWWLLHCHFSWHHITGMELVILVGNKNDLPPTPKNFPKCDNWKPSLQMDDDYCFFPKIRYTLMP
ncbi:laccase ARB_05828 [Apis florea]|uniref:laccase ARB_05828 n=1 Tax=Apis florea TaxID=7463 RepID=UPI0006296EA2|nr:laccase ARB_05828 [Apis florea]